MARLSRFGFFLTIVLPEILPAPSQRGRTNAFSALMLGAQAASSTKLPEKHTSDDTLRGDGLLENDIIDWLAVAKLGFRNGLETSVGKSFIWKLHSVLFELTSERVERLQVRGCTVPALFEPLLKKNYNNPGKHGHKRLPPLSRTMIEEMSQSVLELSSVPAVQVASWTTVRDGLRLLAKQLDKYTVYLDGATVRMNSVNESMEPVRSTESGEKASLVRHSARVQAAEKCQLYGEVEAALSKSEPYSCAVHLNDFLPNNRRERNKFIHGMEFPFPYELFSYDPVSNVGCLCWAWKVPVDPADSNSTASLKLVKQCKKDVPPLATRAMRKTFIERYQIVTECSPAVLRNMFQFVSGDVAQSSCAISKAVQERLAFALDAQDPDIVVDLCALSEGRQGRYAAFWVECGQFLADQAITAVDDRRHGQVMHMATAISTRDLMEQDGERLPEDIPVPGESWLRLQFCPKNTSYAAACHYTGKLDIKHMVQARQLSHNHVDSHYAAAQFR